MGPIYNSHCLKIIFGITVVENYNYASSNITDSQIKQLLLKKKTIVAKRVGIGLFLSVWRSRINSSPISTLMIFIYKKSLIKKKTNPKLFIIRLIFHFSCECTRSLEPWFPVNEA